MALADVLTKLKNQRNAIVTAINGKGGTLGTDATLADCATAINGISTGGGGIEFYKCSALVEGTPPTWNGYKVIPGSSNYYALEATATTGLSYSSIVPEIGKIYSADARMIIEDYFRYEYGLTVKTLVNKATNNAGGKANTYGDGNFNTDGWYVLTSDQSFTAMGTDYMSDNNYFGRYNNMTLSFKFRYPAGSVGDGGVVARLDKSYGWMQLNMNSAGKFSIERHGNIIYDATPTDNTPLADLSPDTDYKFTFVFGADVFNVYLNGTKIYTAKSKNTTDKPDYLYLHTNGGYPASTATYWFKDVYVFTRCLTEAEIATL